MKFHHHGWVWLLQAKLCSGCKIYMKQPKRYSLPDYEAADQADRWSSRQTGTDSIFSQKKKCQIFPWLSSEQCSFGTNIKKEIQGLGGKLQLQKQMLPTARNRKMLLGVLVSGSAPWPFWCYSAQLAKRYSQCVTSEDGGMHCSKITWNKIKTNQKFTSEQPSS